MTAFQPHPSWLGLARPSTSLSLESCKDVDGRAKPGHDDDATRRQ